MAVQKKEPLKEKDEFDSNSYLVRFYGNTTVLENNGTIPNVLWWLHEIFFQGKIKGKQLLDIGTGPSICSTISASPHFEEVYLSDFSEANRRVLRDWKSGTLSYSFAPFFKFVLNMENNEENWETREEGLRVKTREILLCDMREDNPLAPLVPRPFDAVTSTFCLHVAATDLEDYGRVARRVVSLVKPGGWIIVTDCIEETFYMVGGTLFKTAFLTAEGARKAWVDAGVEIKMFCDERRPEWNLSERTDFKGYFKLACLRKL